MDGEVVIHAGLRLSGAVPMLLEASLVNAVVHLLDFSRI